MGAALSNVPLLRSGLWLEPERHFRSPEQPDRIPEQSDRVREEPEIVMGLGVGANRLASNLQTPKLHQALSSLDVYRAP